jgi:hypothetical protein
MSDQRGKLSFEHLRTVNRKQTSYKRRKGRIVARAMDHLSRAVRQR